MLTELSKRLNKSVNKDLLKGIHVPKYHKYYKSTKLNYEELQYPILWEGGLKILNQDSVKHYSTVLLYRTSKEFV